MRSSSAGLARWAVIGALATSAVAFAAARPADGQEADVTYSFVSANSAADGLRLVVDTPEELPISPLLSLTPVAAEAFVETDRSTAIALLPDPGPAVVNAPGLVAGLLGINNLPGYPVVARATHPFTPTADASPVAGSGLAVVRASASEDRAEAAARVGRLSDTPLPLEALSDLLAPILGDLVPDGVLIAAEEVSSHAVEERTSEGLVSRATTTIAGLSLFGGLIEIDSIESTAEAELVDDVLSAGEPTVTYSGLRIAGDTVRIGEDGLVVAQHATGPLGPLLAPILRPLEDLLALDDSTSLRIRLDPGERLVDESSARVRSSALAITLETEQQGIPILVDLRLAETRAAVQVVRSAPVTNTPAGPPPAPPPTATGTPGPGPALDTGAPSTAPLTVTEPRPDETAAPAATIRPGTPAGVLDSLRLPYLLMMLGAAGIVITPLATSRLRGGRSGVSPDLEELYRW